MRAPFFLTLLPLAIACSDSSGTDAHSTARLTITAGAAAPVDLTTTNAHFVLFAGPAATAATAAIITPATGSVPKTLFNVDIQQVPLGSVPVTYDVANLGPLAVAATTWDSNDERALADSGTVTITKGTPDLVEGTVHLRYTFFQTNNGPRDPLRVQGSFTLTRVETIPFPFTRSAPTAP